MSEWPIHGCTVRRSTPAHKFFVAKVAGGQRTRMQGRQPRPYNNCVQIDLSRPGKPTDNAHVESFNGTLRAECLDVHWFVTLTEAKQIIGDWRREYSESRPHRSLGRTDSK